MIWNIDIVNLKSCRIKSKKVFYCSWLSVSCIKTLKKGSKFQTPPLFFLKRIWHFIIKKKTTSRISKVYFYIFLFLLVVIRFKSMKREISKILFNFVGVSFSGSTERSQEFWNFQKPTVEGWHHTLWHRFKFLW